MPCNTRAKSVMSISDIEAARSGVRDDARQRRGFGDGGQGRIDHRRTELRLEPCAFRRESGAAENDAFRAEGFSAARPHGKDGFLQQDLCGWWRTRFTPSCAAAMCSRSTTHYCADAHMNSRSGTILKSTPVRRSLRRTNSEGRTSGNAFHRPNPYLPCLASSISFKSPKRLMAVS